MKTLDVDQSSLLVEDVRDLGPLFCVKWYSSDVTLTLYTLIEQQAVSLRIQAGQFITDMGLSIQTGAMHLVCNRSHCHSVVSFLAQIVCRELLPAWLLTDLRLHPVWRPKGPSQQWK